MLPTRKAAHKIIVSCSSLKKKKKIEGQHNSCFSFPKVGAQCALNQIVQPGKLTVQQRAISKAFSLLAGKSPLQCLCARLAV